MKKCFVVFLLYCLMARGLFKYVRPEEQQGLVHSIECGETKTEKAAKIELDW